MHIDKVIEYFDSINLKERVHVFSELTATVHQAALELGVEDKLIAKSMSFYLDDNKPIIVLTAGDTKIDNHKYKEYFGTKAKMIPYEGLTESTNCVPGGVCPFCIKDNVSVYLDNSLKRFEYVYPAAGSNNSAVKLSIEELEKYSFNFKGWIDVSKPVEE